jgi:hypothetical protein
MGGSEEGTSAFRRASLLLDQDVFLGMRFYTTTLSIAIAY